MGGHVENVFEFCIGDTVIASRRKVTPLNEEGVWQELPNPLGMWESILTYDTSLITAKSITSIARN